MVSNASDSSAFDFVGLCSGCAYGQCVGHPRKGKAYWRCDKSVQDTRFPKYPRLPIIECLGFEAANKD